MSASDSRVSIKSSCERSIRRCTSHRWVETPKLALNDLAKWLIERPHSAASSESRIRPDRSSLSNSVARRFCDGPRPPTDRTDGCGGRRLTAAYEVAAHHPPDDLTGRLGRYHARDCAVHLPVS